MPSKLRLSAVFASAALAAAGADNPPAMSWLPAGLPPASTNGPTLCTGGYLTPAQGKALLDAALVQFPDHESWDTYARLLRDRIRQGAGPGPLAAANAAESHHPRTPRP